MRNRGAPADAADTGGAQARVPARDRRGPLSRIPLTAGER